MAEDSAKYLTIKPFTTRGLFDLSEVLRYRELLYFFVWRDIKVRYKQSVLGVAWVVLKPVVAMAIFTVIFGRIARFPSDGVPYAVFVLAGIIPWNFFSSSVTGASNSIVGGGGLLNKVYFPRLIAPFSATLTPLVDAAIPLVLLFGMAVYYGITPGPAVLWTPLIFILAALTALGPGMLFAALYVKYRDVGHILPFVVQVWMYVTPVIFPADFIPPAYRWALYLNPMSGVVEAFRACLFPGKVADPALILSSVAISAVMFLVGLYYFRSVERSFADNI